MTTLDARRAPPPPPPPKVEPKKDPTTIGGPAAAKAAGAPKADDAADAPAVKDPSRMAAARKVASAADADARARVQTAPVAVPTAAVTRGLSADGPGPLPVAANDGPTPLSATAPVSESAAAAPPKSFTERAAEIDDMAARNTFVEEVAKKAGLDNPQFSGLATLSPGDVQRRAGMGANLAYALDEARTSGSERDINDVTKAITDSFGEGAVAKFDAALETAKAAGPVPEHPPFASPDAPFSKALTEALKPVAREGLLADHMRGQTEALDAAYAQMSPAERTELDAKVAEVADRRGFVDGAEQALKDLGSDVSAAATLAVDLATDPAAREKLGQDIETLTTALGDPATRGAVIDAIKSELGEGVVDALVNFNDNPSYNTGYLAATVASGGAIGRAVSVVGQAARIGEIASRAADIARRTRIELPDANQLNSGAPFRVGLAGQTARNLETPADVLEGVSAKALRRARDATVANPRAFVKGTTGDFFKKGAHVSVQVGNRNVEITLKGNTNGGIDFGNVNLAGAAPKLKELEDAENAVRLRLANDPGFRAKLRAEIEAGLEAAAQKSSEQGQVAGAERLLEILRRMDP